VNRIAIVLAASFVIFCVGVSQILPSFASYSSIKTVASSGTIVYPTVYYTYVVSTLTELTNVISEVVPGDTVFIRGGIYQPTSPIVFQTSGTPSNPITYEAYPNEKVVFDGSLATDASLGGDGSWEPPLVHIYGNWNILRNIEVRNSPGSGILVYGADVILDHVETHHNRGVGANTVGDRCQFLYCVSHDNIDPQATIPGGDADGLGASAPSSGSYFLGCVAYGNSDDGFDLWGSTGNTVENCVAYGNGLLQGNGQGFKLAIGGNNYVSKCIAYNNRAAGFGSEEEAPNNFVDHCTAYNNGQIGFLSAYLSSGTFTNNIGSFSWWQAEPTHYSNSWNFGLTNYGFISTDLTSVDFLSLRADSPCRSKASDGSDLGALQYGERISDLLGT